MLALLIAVAAILTGQAVGLPFFYATRHQGCDIPQQGYAGHPNPEANPSITVELADAMGEPVAPDALVPGTTYTVTVSAYEPSDINMWVYASGGTLTPAPEFQEADSCGAGEGAIYTFSEAGTPFPGPLTFEWTAPAGRAPVMRIAQAAFSTVAYQTAEVTFALSGASAPGAGAAGGGPLPAGGPDASAASPPSDDAPATGPTAGPGPPAAAPLAPGADAGGPLGGDSSGGAGGLPPTDTTGGLLPGATGSGASAPAAGVGRGAGAPGAASAESGNGALPAAGVLCLLAASGAAAILLAGGL